MPPEEGIEVNLVHISPRPSASYICFNASEFSKILFKDFPLEFSPFTFCHWIGRNFTSLPKKSANCQDITKILYWVLVQPWHCNPMPEPFSKEAPALRGFQDFRTCHFPTAQNQTFEDPSLWTWLMIQSSVILSPCSQCSLSLNHLCSLYPQLPTPNLKHVQEGVCIHRRK